MSESEVSRELTGHEMFMIMMHMCDDLKITLEEFLLTIGGIMVKVSPELIQKDPETGIEGIVMTDPKELFKIAEYIYPILKKCPEITGDQIPLPN